MNVSKESLTFRLIAGNPSLDFVNTLDDRFAQGGPIELLNGYGDLLSFSGRTGLIAPDILARLRAIEANLKDEVIARARNLRETLARIYYSHLDHESMEPDDLAKLSELRTVATGMQRLAPAPDGFEWLWTDPEYDFSLPIWTLTNSATTLLTSPDLALVRACASPDCRWLFLDTSKNHQRRWCDMKLCGNRMKARRFARHSPLQSKDRQPT